MTPMLLWALARLDHLAFRGVTRLYQAAEAVEGIACRVSVGFDEVRGALVGLDRCIVCGCLPSYEDRCTLAPRCGRCAESGFDAMTLAEVRASYERPCVCCDEEGTPLPYPRTHTR